MQLRAVMIHTNICRQCTVFVINLIKRSYNLKRKQRFVVNNQNYSFAMKRLKYQLEMSSCTCSYAYEFYEFNESLYF